MNGLLPLSRLAHALVEVAHVGRGMTAQRLRRAGETARDGLNHRAPRAGWHGAHEVLAHGGSFLCGLNR